MRSVALPVVVVIAALFALAGSSATRRWAGSWSSLSVCSLRSSSSGSSSSPSYLLQTERFLDITGGLTYVTVCGRRGDPLRRPRRPRLAARHGGRLGRAPGLVPLPRIRKAGTDKRFDDIKPSLPRFLNTWTLQGLWVTLTASAALAAITSTDLWSSAPSPPSACCCGWPASPSRSPPTPRRAASAPTPPTGPLHPRGLWSLVASPQLLRRDPAVGRRAVVAVPALRGWQWVTLLSPVFVALLLLR